MNGFIHIYTRGKEPKSDQITIRFDKVNAAAYDSKLHPIHIDQLQKNIYAKDSYGSNTYQGNIGTLQVSLPEKPDTSLADTHAFLGQFNGHLVEFTLSDNVKVVPTYGLHPPKRDSFTIIKFHQFDARHDCYHEVMLMTKEGSLNFTVSHTDTPQHINFVEWHEAFEKNNFCVDMEETHADVDRELFLEDIFHGVTEEALVSTGIGRAFDPTFRVLPVSDEAAVVKKAPVEPAMEEEIKVGMLMMLEPESDDEDEVDASTRESDSSEDDVCHEYDPVTNEIRKLQEDCQKDMVAPLPAYNTLIDSASIGIIQTPDLLKQTEPHAQTETPLRMSDLISVHDTEIAPLIKKVE